MSSINIIGEVTDQVYVGAATVGLTESQLSGTNKLTRGVQLYCPADNANTVYVGNRSGVTANAADDTTGFPIPAGGGVFFPCNSLDDVYLIADGAGQKVFYLAY